MESLLRFFIIFRMLHDINGGQFFDMDNLHGWMDFRFTNA